MRTIDIAHPEALRAATKALRGGGVIALPTDTVYGLACDAHNEGAAAQVFAIKGRAGVKPLTLFVSNVEEALRLGRPALPDHERVMRRFWPGPLTVVLRPLQRFPPGVTGEGGTVGVRVPDHAFCLDLLRALGGPLATTSANLSGGADIREASKVAEELGGALALLLDGGVLPRRAPSLVVDLSAVPPRILRPGERAIEIAALLGLTPPP
jgi:L-threonylcarbamoyladenylate synthase